MHARAVRRSLVAALSLTMIVATAASADGVPADGDALTPGNQNFIDLGTVGVGGTVSADIAFTLVCRTGVHAERGSTITVGFGSASLPGGAVSVSETTIGPVPDDWPLDTQGCPSTGQPTLASNGVSTVTITAPGTAGDYLIPVFFSRDPSDGITTNTLVNFTLGVTGNTPPSLALPADIVVEGDTTGGWTSAFAVGASDAEDAADPAVTCSPMIGSLLPLGLSSVSCSATDSGGMMTSGSIGVTVLDTTAPGITSSGPIAVETTDPDGAVVTWPGPAAVDVVDPAPTLGCSPASGSLFPVGTTPVTCTARDASGNRADVTFPVTVTLRRTLSATWGQPVGSTGLTANHGRTIPLKATIAIDGVVVGGGGPAARLRVQALSACAGGSATGVVLEQAMTWDGGRSSTNLDTSSLGLGCWHVSVSVDGVAGGGFDLQLVDGAVGSSGGTASKAPTRTRTSAR